MPKKSRKKGGSSKSSSGGQSNSKGGDSATAGSLAGLLEDELRLQADDATSVGASSKCSDLTEEGSVAGENGVDEVEMQELFEEKLKEYIDGTTEKSAQTRQESWEKVLKSLSAKLLPDFVLDHRVTLMDCVERSLKKGRGEEQCLAVRVAVLLCIQLGAGSDSELVFNSLRNQLQVVLQDKTANFKARAQCALASGLCCFIASGDMEVVLECMNLLSTIFKDSFLKGDGTTPSHPPAATALHCSALSYWALLLTIVPASRVDDLAQTYLPRLSGLLESDDVNLRIAAGQTIALLYELVRESDEDFQAGNEEVLVEKLRALSTDSNKYRAKKDRRQQRSSFRDILRTIEEDEYPEELIKFGGEELELDSWVRTKQYEAFRELLGSGLSHHLQANELLRDIFGLGEPLTPTTKAGVVKMSKFERHMCNSANFKARTQTRSKQRDKRVATY